MDTESHLPVDRYLLEQNMKETVRTEVPTAWDISSEVFEEIVQGYESQAVNPNIDTPQSLYTFLYKLYQDRMSHLYSEGALNFSVVPEEKRKENALAANKKQKADISDPKFLSLLNQLCEQESVGDEKDRSIFSHQISHGGFNSAQRLLNEASEKINERLVKPEREIVLYYRPAMSPEEFAFMLWVVDWYVSQGYSSVFTGVKVCSIMPNQYPASALAYTKSTTYTAATDQDFRFETGIGANIVHLTHGTPEQSVFCHAGIGLGYRVQEDRERMKLYFKKLGNYCVSFPFEFGPPNYRKKRDIGLLPMPLSITNIIKESIFLVQAMERDILDDLNPKKKTTRKLRFLFEHVF